MKKVQEVACDWASPFLLDEYGWLSCISLLLHVVLYSVYWQLKQSSQHSALPQKGKLQKNSSDWSNGKRGWRVLVMFPSQPPPSAQRGPNAGLVFSSITGYFSGLLTRSQENLKYITSDLKLKWQSLQASSQKPCSWESNLEPLWGNAKVSRLGKRSGQGPNTWPCPLTHSMRMSWGWSPHSKVSPGSWRVCWARRDVPCETTDPSKTPSHGSPFYSPSDPNAAFR